MSCPLSDEELALLQNCRALMAEDFDRARELCDEAAGEILRLRSELAGTRAEVAAALSGFAEPREVVHVIAKRWGLL